MTTTPAMPERFTKKPVTIEAVQFTEALRDAIVLDGAPCPEGVKRGATTWHQKDRKIWRAEFFIDTLEGRMNVEVGDWIIKGVKGEFYPCKPDIFEMTYDRATLQAQAQPAAVSDAEVDRAVQIIANDRGCGWPHIPESWKDEFRETARAILALRPQAVPMTDEVKEKALDLLETMFDAYENGVPCHEDNGGGYIGMAFSLDNETFHACADILNAHRPKAHHGITAQGAQGEQA